MVRHEGENHFQKCEGSPVAISKGSTLWGACAGLYICGAISDGYRSNACVL